MNLCVIIEFQTFLQKNVGAIPPWLPRFAEVRGNHGGIAPTEIAFQKTGFLADQALL